MFPRRDALLTPPSRRDAEHSCAPAVPVSAALDAYFADPGYNLSFDQVRGAVSAYVSDVASPVDVGVLFSRSPSGQSIAHWAAANDRSDILIAIAAPLVLEGRGAHRHEALRGVLVLPDQSPTWKNPAHVAGFCGRRGMLRLYADPRLGISGALLAPDAFGNNVAHQWVLGGRSVQDLRDLAQHMQLPPRHALWVALTRRNGQGLLPADMRRGESPVPDVRPAALAWAGARSSGPSP